MDVDGEVGGKWANKDVYIICVYIIIIIIIYIYMFIVHIDLIYICICLVLFSCFVLWLLYNFLWPRDRQKGQLWMDPGPYVCDKL